MKKGKTLSAEQKQKMSDIQRGRPKSEEYRAKISAGVKRYLLTQTKIVTEA